MFSFTSTIYLSLALLAPLSVSALQGQRCALPKQLEIPGLPAAFQQSTLTASWVGVAVGVQNYTCGATGTFTNVGAVAELFDISCFIRNPLFASLPDIAIAAWEGTSDKIATLDLINALRKPLGAAVLGQHYFVVNPLTGTGIEPKWDFTSGAFSGVRDAFVVAAKNISASAPTGSQDIDWVFLTALPGNSHLAAQVFRTDTRLGQPLANCTVGTPDISVKYAAKYCELTLVRNLILNRAELIMQGDMERLSSAAASEAAS